LLVDFIAKLLDELKWRRVKMRKVLIGITTFSLVLAGAASAYAGAVINKTNWSAEYIRTLNRNAATDYADIAAFNPAGTVKMTDGLTINGSVQYLDKDYKNKVNGMHFKSDKSSTFPGVFAVYKKDKWTLFGSFTFVGGGGEVDWEDGDATTMALGAGMTVKADRTMDAALQAPPPSGPGLPPALLGTYYGTLTHQDIWAKSYDLGYSFGGAYAINDIFSVSAAIRYVDGTIEAKGKVTTSPTTTGAGFGGTPQTSEVDFEQNADGWGAIFGVNIAPNERLNIGARFETKTDLEFDTDVKKDNNNVLPQLGIVDGQDMNEDLAPSLGLGVSYWLTEKLRAETNLTLYFNGEADWEGKENDVDTGYDAGLALEYVFNDKIMASIGYMHTETGIDPEDMKPENPELDANTFAGGLAYAYNQKFHVNLAVGYSSYEDDDFVSKKIPNTDIKIEYEKDVTFYALGLEYRFM
jgi:long-chain fatty acid transport protein